ncbi:MAG TPA: hypothetical protein VL175_11775 [Pirellulales bacterium]|jgi:hypothetical protein|nr:hypothetical protein [Pirellulales bacterium]
MSRSRALMFALALVAITSALVAADAPKTVSGAGGKLAFKVPDAWTEKQPQSAITERELSIPAAGDDKTDGRLTMMSAGGGVEANLERWYGQFTQPDGGNSRERAKVSKLKVSGCEVHVVDLSGTFRDQRGPVAPAVERPKYRMLAAIVVTPKAGNYFIKFYGPERTVAENERAFMSMIQSLETK